MNSKLMDITIIAPYQINIMARLEQYIDKNLEAITICCKELFMTLSLKS